MKKPNADQAAVLSALVERGGTVPSLAALIRLSRWTADGRNNAPAYNAMHRLRSRGWISISRETSAVRITDLGKRATEI